MRLLLIAGSPSASSRSTALLDAVAARLAPRDWLIDRIAIRELDAPALLQGDVAHPSVCQAVQRVADADAIVIATPVYKAAYSGALKVFLDLLPQTALRGKVALPLATGGSPHHMLALDYALRPVLQSLGARNILPGIYATDQGVSLLPEGGYILAADIAQRVEDAAALLADDLRRDAIWSAAAQTQQPIAFADVRCSV